MGFGTPSISTPIAASLGGTGVANNAASTITISGNFGTTFTVSGATSVTLPTSGTLAAQGAAVSFTTITATTAFVMPDSNAAPTLHGDASTDAGISTRFSRTYIWAGGSLVAEYQSGQIVFYVATQLTNPSINVTGVAFTPKPGGAIFDHFADGASTNTNGTEDTLYTDTLAAGALNANGAKIWGNYQVAIVGHVTATARTRLYFGGTVIFDTTAFNNTTNYALSLLVRVIRVSATVVRCCVVATSTSTLAVPVSTYTEVTGLDLTAVQVIKLTGIAASTNAASGDITAKLGALYWEPAA